VLTEREVTKVKETSPVFHQFLDATYQLLYQHPTRFEFNERFLRRLLYHVYSCQYGTFLCNNEKERFEANVKIRTRSVWDYFLSRKEQFTNPQYDPIIDDNKRGKERLLFPRTTEVRWWSEAFGRADGEMNFPRVLGVNRSGRETPSGGRTPVLTSVEISEQSISSGNSSKLATVGMAALTAGLTSLGPPRSRENSQGFTTPTNGASKFEIEMQ